MRFPAQLFTYGWIESIYYHDRASQVGQALVRRAFSLLGFYGRLPGVQAWWKGSLLTLDGVPYPGAA